MSPFLNAVAASELQRLHYQVAGKHIFLFLKYIYMAKCKKSYFLVYIGHLRHAQADWLRLGRDHGEK